MDNIIECATKKYFDFTANDVNTCINSNCSVECPAFDADCKIAKSNYD